jgi:hypothetical protein
LNNIIKKQKQPNPSTWDLIPQDNGSDDIRLA